VIVISHSLPEVFEIADRITVLRLGRTIATLERTTTGLTEIVGMMTGAWEATAEAANGAANGN